MKVQAGTSSFATDTAASEIGSERLRRAVGGRKVNGFAAPSNGRWKGPPTRLRTRSLAVEPWPSR